MRKRGLGCNSSTQACSLCYLTTQPARDWAYFTGICLFFHSLFYFVHLSHFELAARIRKE